MLLSIFYKVLKVIGLLLLVLALVIGWGVLVQAIPKQLLPYVASVLFILFGTLLYRTLD